MIRRLVLDVLKPHDPGIVPFSESVAETNGVAGVTAKLEEIDEDVRTIRMSVEGESLDYDVLESKITDLGGTIHSIDEVSCGDEIIEDPWIKNR